MLLLLKHRHKAETLFRSLLMRSEMVCLRLDVVVNVTSVLVFLWQLLSARLPWIVLTEKEGKCSMSDWNVISKRTHTHDKKHCAILNTRSFTFAGTSHLFASDMWSLKPSDEMPPASAAKEAAPQNECSVHITTTQSMCSVSQQISHSADQHCHFTFHLQYLKDTLPIFTCSH